jgi:hypothetical protein
VLDLLRFLAPKPRPAGPEPAEILKAAGDVLKVSTGLATGALVFSVGLLGDAQSYDLLARVLLAASWGLLVLSVLGGLLSQAAIPPLLAEKRFSLEEPTFTWPGRIHQVLLFLAILLLAIAMGSNLFHQTPELRVDSAAKAVAKARLAVQPDGQVRRLSAVELLAGPAGSAIAPSWRVQFELEDAASARLSYADVMVDAQTGRASRIR